MTEQPGPCGALAGLQAVSARLQGPVQTFAAGQQAGGLTVRVRIGFWTLKHAKQIAQLELT